MDTRLVSLTFNFLVQIFSEDFEPEWEVISSKLKLNQNRSNVNH